MIWNLIGTIGGKVLDIVDDVVEDKDATGSDTTTRRWALEPRGSTLPKSKKRSAIATP